MTMDEWIGAPPVAEGQVAVRLRAERPKKKTKKEREKEERELEKGKEEEEEREFEEYADRRMKEMTDHHDKMLKIIPF